MFFTSRIPPQCTTTALALVFNIIVQFLAAAPCFAAPNVEIRFSAAVSAYKKNFQANQPFDSYNESAAYDVIWKGKLAAGGFQTESMKILYGGGFTNNVFKIGGGSCTGTLAVSSADASFSPGSTVKNGIVTMSIPLPHAVLNGPIGHLLQDNNAPQLSACRTASTELGRATCFNPTRDCYTIDGSISPDFALPGDEDPFQRFTNHRDYAYFQFNLDKPSTSIPFSYNVNNTLIDSSGTTTDTYKIVWSGYVTISTSVGSGFPPPVDPFTFFNFDPSTVSGPPADASPPGNPFSNSDPIDPTTVRNWLKPFGPIINSFSKTVQGLNSVGAAHISRGTKIALEALIEPVAGTTFDSDTGASSINTAFIGETPPSGTIQVKYKVLTPDKARDFKLTISKKSAGTSIVQGQDATIPFTVDRSSLALLKSGKAAKVFFTVQFIPTGSKATFVKQFSFALKKRKK